jgi:ribosome-binding factor A
VLAPDDARDRALEALAHSAGFVRHELAPRLGLREVPEIRFLLDTSIQHGARVEELLRRIASGEIIDDEPR